MPQRFGRNSGNRETGIFVTRIKIFGRAERLVTSLRQRRYRETVNCKQFLKQ